VDTDLIIERTRDIDLINSVMFDDDIFNVISEDGATKERQRFDVYNEYWLKVTVDDDLVGLYNLHTTNQSTLEAHVHILPEFRKQHSNASIRKVYKWLIDNCGDEVVKFIANIPSIYPNVLRFCLSNGFTHEGINRKSYLKNNLIHDVDMVGITKEEMKGVLNG
jgi:hypothetical protein